MNVTACLVTRGNVDMLPIAESIIAAGITDVVSYDNSVGENHGVYGRYVLIEDAAGDVVYVQDDDCLLPPESIIRLLEAYEPGRIVANMSADFRANYTDSCLVGFGAVFDRDLPARAFERFRGAGRPWDFRNRPDVIFTALTPFTLVDVPVEILPYAYGRDRMYRQRGHAAQRHKALQHARAVRAKVSV